MKIRTLTVGRAGPCQTDSRTNYRKDGFQLEEGPR